MRGAGEWEDPNCTFVPTKALFSRIAAAASPLPPRSVVFEKEEGSTYGKRMLVACVSYTKVFMIFCHLVLTKLLPIDGGPLFINFESMSTGLMTSGNPCF